MHLRWIEQCGLDRLSQAWYQEHKQKEQELWGQRPPVYCNQVFTSQLKGSVVEFQALSCIVRVGSEILTPKTMCHSSMSRRKPEKAILKTLNLVHLLCHSLLATHQGTEVTAITQRALPCDQPRGDGANASGNHAREALPRENRCGESYVHSFWGISESSLSPHLHFHSDFHPWPREIKWLGSRQSNHFQ